MDQFNRQWITQNALEEIQNYAKGVLTIRGLHYRMVSRGMTNSQRHYKRVVGAMIQARWEGLVDFDQFSDNDREVLGYTSAEITDLDEGIDAGKRNIKAWMEYYNKNRWENQEVYPEVWIEKKALQGVFSDPCNTWDVALAPCKGYPSLTFLHEGAERFMGQPKKPIILYFGDYDPSGEDIPRSVQENLFRMGADVEVRRIALLENQVIDWNLPPAPAKVTDSRTAAWDGLGQVELDAVEPGQLRQLCADAIKDIFDEDLYDELMDQEEEEREQYRDELKEYVKTL